MTDHDSEQKPAKQAAAELDALLEAAVDAIILIDQDGRIENFNTAAERLFGYAENEVRGQNVEMLMPEPYRSEHKGYMARYLRSGEPHVIGIGRDVEARKRNGEVFPICLSVGETQYADKRRFVGIIRDLTEIRATERERHALEARLQRVGRFSLMGEMAAGIAHEINQPLTAIANYSQAAIRMLASADLNREDLEQACTGISEQAHRAGKVIENLRSFIGKQNVRKGAIDLNGAIRGVLSLVRSDTNAAGIPLSVSYAANLPAVDANAVQLQQVLLNLTHNAVDAMRQSLRKDEGITIATARAQDGGLEFSVSDHGGGIPTSLADAIFHPFVTTKKDGLGVGLAISQTIVRALGGALAYRNNEGGGSTFTVHLPALLGEFSD
jgi:two-component system sensor kinase FixL